MKHLKFTVLLAVFAATITGIFGVGSASATVLCKQAKVPCPAESTYHAGSAIEATLKSGTTVQLGAPLSETCTGSTLSGEATAETGGPLPIKITSLTLSGTCNPCKTAAATNLPYSGGVEYTSSGNASVNVENGGSGTPHLAFSACTFLKLTCTFGVGKGGWSMQGGNPATLVANKVPLVFEGGTGGTGLCGETSSLSATYEISNPKPVYPSLATGTALCAENATPCPAGATYPEETTIEASASSAKIGSLSVCSSSSMGVSTSQEFGAPLGATLSSLTFAGCGGTCSVATAKAPVAAGFEAGGGGNGTLTTSVSLTLSKCTALNYTCEFSGQGRELSVEGGNPAKIGISDGELAFIGGTGGEAKCGSSLKLSASWTLSSPKALWVTTGL